MNQDTNFQKLCDADSSCLVVVDMQDKITAAMPQAANRPQVVLAGIELHICVTQTAIDLQAAGYQPWVVVDAAGSRQRDSYDYSMMRLRSCGICLTETEAVLFEWLRDASHPKFKDVSARLTSN